MTGASACLREVASASNQMPGSMAFSRSYICRLTIPGPDVRGPTGNEPIYCCPFISMSFLTDCTPLTLRATSTALLMLAREPTKPPRGSPCNVCWWISRHHGVPSPVQNVQLPSDRTDAGGSHPGYASLGLTLQGTPLGERDMHAASMPTIGLPPPVVASEQTSPLASCSNRT